MLCDSKAHTMVTVLVIRRMVIQRCKCVVSTSLCSSDEIYVLLFYVAEDHGGILLARAEVKLSQILRRFPPMLVGFCLLHQIANIIFM